MEDLKENALPLKRNLRYTVYLIGDLDKGWKAVDFLIKYAKHSQTLCTLSQSAVLTQRLF